MFFFTPKRSIITLRILGCVGILMTIFGIDHAIQVSHTYSKIYVQAEMVSSSPREKYTLYVNCQGKEFILPLEYHRSYNYRRRSHYYIPQYSTIKLDTSRIIGGKNISLYCSLNSQGELLLEYAGFELYVNQLYGLIWFAIFGVLIPGVIQHHEMRKRTKK